MIQLSIGHLLGLLEAARCARDLSLNQVINQYKNAGVSLEIFTMDFDCRAIAHYR